MSLRNPLPTRLTNLNGNFGKPAFTIPKVKKQPLNRVSGSTPEERMRNANTGIATATHLGPLDKTLMDKKAAISQGRLNILTTDQTQIKGFADNSKLTANCSKFQIVSDDVQTLMEDPKVAAEVQRIVTELIAMPATTDYFCHHVELNFTVPDDAVLEGFTLDPDEVAFYHQILTVLTAYGFSFDDAEYGTYSSLDYGATFEDTWRNVIDTEESVFPFYVRIPHEAHHLMRIIEITLQKKNSPYLWLNGISMPEAGQLVSEGIHYELSNHDSLVYFLFDRDSSTFYSNLNIAGEIAVLRSDANVNAIVIDTSNPIGRRLAMAIKEQSSELTESSLEDGAQDGSAIALEFNDLLWSDWVDTDIGGNYQPEYSNKALKKVRS
jgi:hypothetical protein